MQSAENSGQQSGTTVIFAGPCQITRVKINAPTNDGKVIVYDNASAASGKILDETEVLTANKYGGSNWPGAAPDRCYNGITAIGTGTGITYNISYIPKAG